jgi:hypothetical protein
MNFGENIGEKRTDRNIQAEPGASNTEDLALEQALKNFRISVVAWSDAAYGRPRAVTQAVRRRSWRLAIGWAMGCALAVGVVAGAGYERHRAHEMARIEAARLAGQQRLAIEQEGRVRQQQALAEEEDLLAKVDSDVSREVPSAMEPLAQLMAEDERQ